MKLRLIALIAGFLIAMSGAVMAQDQDAPPLPDGQNQADSGPDSSSGVARISLIHGDVSTQRGDSGEWQAAALNAPVVAGDRVSTGDRSRAELQLGNANVLRLDEHAQANIVALDRNTIQVQLGQGRANYTVLRNSDANAQIDAPNVSLHPDRRDGSYAIYVSGDGHTEVIVRRGSADISTPQGSTHVDSGQMITVEGTGDQTQYKIAGAPGRDDFDRWASDRDHMIQSAQSWHHTNGYYTGSEDLDTYGHWKDVPDYGSVWVPTTGPGWAPYRDGQWVWEPGWGWTWVSSEPWGWAPYHYGRWMYVDGGWGWWPGPVYANPYYYPVWAPAYVSFFGFGGGWGGGFGFGGGWGSIGWLPIGPCDHFYPWWGGYRSRFNTVNITNVNITNINNNRGGWGPLHGGTMYSNIRHAVNDPGFRRSISTVPSNQFGHGRVAIQPVRGEMFRNAHLVNGNLPVVPTRQSTQISGRPAAASTMSNRMQNQRFFSNSRTPAATRASFAQEQARVQNNIRQNSRFTPINGNQVSGGNQRTMANEGNGRFGAAARPGMNSAPTSQMQRPVQARPGNGGNTASEGWRRLGGPAGQSTATNNSQPRTFGNRTAEPVARGGNSTWNAAPRPGNSNANDRVATPARPTNNGGNWRQSTPAPSRPSAGETVNRGSQNQSWRAPSPRSSASDSRSYGRSSNDYSRPPLNMRQPIVTPRDYSRPSYGGAPYGGNRGSYSAPAPRSYSPPSYSAPSRGGYSAPSRGGYSAPSRGGYSAPSHGGGGGSRSSGGSGGSHSSGGSSRSSSSSSSGHHGR
jgi:hypothetical protein